MILIVESSRPFNPTTGGSFRSLQVVVECLQRANEPVCVSFYFDNEFVGLLEAQGASTVVLKYISPYHWFKRRMPCGKARAGTSRTSEAAKSISAQSGSSLSICRRANNATLFKKIIGLAYDFVLAALNTSSMIRLIRSQDVDVVYCNTGVTIDRTAIAAGLLTRKKVICHLRNLPTLTGLDRFLLRRVDATVSISKTVADHYKAQKAFLPTQSIILLNALGEDFEKIKKSLGPNVLAVGDNFSIGCFSRLIEWKGGQSLIEGFALYLGLGGRGVLRFFGDGPQQDALKRSVSNLGLESRVVFEGYAQDITTALRSCSVAVSPSIKPEPLGRVVMEAMHLGIPVVASDSGGHLETITSGETGFLFKTADGEDLARILKKLYDDPELRITVAEKAMHKAEAWTSEKYCLVLNNFIQTVREEI